MNLKKTIPRLISFSLTQLIIFTCSFLFYNYLVKTNKTLFSISIASGYLGFTLIYFSLIIGPAYIIFCKKKYISINLRRDIGIGGGILAITHSIVALQEHFNGNFLYYFIYPPKTNHLIPLRYDPFGIANYMGLLAGFLILLLIIVSNDYSFKMLGKKKWKKTLDLNYLIFFLIFFHTLLFIVLSKRTFAYILIFFTATITVAIFQFLGFRKIKALKENIFNFTDRH